MAVRAGISSVERRGRRVIRVIATLCSLCIFAAVGLIGPAAAQKVAAFELPQLADDADDYRQRLQRRSGAADRDAPADRGALFRAAKEARQAGRWDTAVRVIDPTRIRCEFES